MNETSKPLNLPLLLAFSSVLPVATMIAVMRMCGVVPENSVWHLTEAVLAVFVATLAFCLYRQPHSSVWSHRCAKIAFYRGASGSALSIGTYLSCVMQKLSN